MIMSTHMTKYSVFVGINCCVAKEVKNGLMIMILQETGPKSSILVADTWRYIKTMIKTNILIRRRQRKADSGAVNELTFTSKEGLQKAAVLHFPILACD